MPIRVKNNNGVSRRLLARRGNNENFAESPSSMPADQLIAIYSFENKESSYDHSSQGIQYPQEPNISSHGSPWGLYFPPPLRNDLLSTDKGTAYLSSAFPESRKSTATGVEYKELDSMDESNPKNFVVPLDSSLKSAWVMTVPSVDSSDDSWSSQSNNVKFKKKLRPKADGLCEWGNESVPRATLSLEGGNDSKVQKSNGMAEDEQRLPESSSSQNDSDHAGTTIWEPREQIEKGVDENLESDAALWRKQMRPQEGDFSGKKKDFEMIEKDMHRLKLKSKDMLPVITPKIKKLLPNRCIKTHECRKCKKVVRFNDPLVTSLNYRPKTKPEEIRMLFFDEDELDILEEDRETTPRDQFEMIAQELSENRLRISIAYQNRCREKPPAN